MGVTLIGIDVGGPSKGFHVVRLSDDSTFELFHAHDPEVVAQWCCDQNAGVIAIDAPCTWGNAKARPAEAALHREGINCFSTPTREIALASPSDFYGWVFNGERMYEALIPPYSLYSGEHVEASACIETFPHAVTCRLLGQVCRGKDKRRDRTAALQLCGLNPNSFPGMDYMDAALCAVAAGHYHQQKYDAVGDASGHIVIPLRNPNVVNLGPSDAPRPTGPAVLRVTAARAGYSTTIGFINKNGQENVACTGLPGTDHCQLVYRLRCTRCAHEYGANGSDIHVRKCPVCGGGCQGLPLG